MKLNFPIASSIILQLMISLEDIPIRAQPSTIAILLTISRESLLSIRYWRNLAVYSGVFTLDMKKALMLFEISRGFDEPDGRCIASLENCSCDRSCSNKSSSLSMMSSKPRKILLEDLGADGKEKHEMWTGRMQTNSKRRGDIQNLRRD